MTSNSPEEVIMCLKNCFFHKPVCLVDEEYGAVSMLEFVCYEKKGKKFSSVSYSDRKVQFYKNKNILHTKQCKHCSGVSGFKNTLNAKI